MGSPEIQELSMKEARSADRDHLLWLERAGIRLGDAPSMLDLGCGSGFLCAQAAAGGTGYALGIDILPPDVAPQQWHYRNSNLNAADWPEHIARPGGFALITAFDIIEHLAAPPLFLQQCLRLLSPGGTLVLTTPNTHSWECLLRKDWSGARDPQHLVLFSPYTLRFLLERSGFTVTMLHAPLRSAGALARFIPQIGGQIFCIAKKELEPVII